MKSIAKLKLILSATSLLLLGACTTVNVDHVQLADSLNLTAGESIVVMGRHQSAEFETEPSLIECLGRRIAGGTNSVSVIPEPEFVNRFYPYFEARTAPLKPARLKAIFDLPIVAEQIATLDLRYFIWVEGSTERTGGSGSMSCSVTGAGGGCFGFATWEDTSDYEAIVWDARKFEEVARVSTDAVGTSYMPAFVVPVPLLARVQSNACQGMGTQLVKFFEGDSTALKVKTN
ncbi:MAG: hypothetical protein AAF197_09020 [Pseudomonadota bacterium]